MEGKLKEKVLGLFRFALNRSLFWKVGFIIGVCVAVCFGLTLYFYLYTQGLLHEAGVTSQSSFYFERVLYLLVILVLFFIIWGPLPFGLW